MPVVLDHAEAGRIKAKGVENFLAHAHVAKTAVDQKRIRQGGEFLISIHIALHAAREHFTHGSVIILSICRAFDLKFAVIAPFGLAFGKNHHRTDGILPGKV